MTTAIVMMSTIIVDENSRLFKTGWLTGNELRYQQYVRGITKFAEMTQKYKYDTFLVDNSVPDDKFTPELKNIFQKFNIKYLYCPPDGANLGAVNKGAGILQAWRQIKTLFKPYTYIIHFEPRQYIHSDFLISRFHSNKGNYIKMRNRCGGMETGFFSIESKALLRYINMSLPSHLIKHNISLENDLYKHFIKHNDKLIKIPILGLYWYFSKRHPNFPAHI